MSLLLLSVPLVGPVPLEMPGTGRCFARVLFASEKNDHFFSMQVYDPFL